MNPASIAAIYEDGNEEEAEYWAAEAAAECAAEAANERALYGPTEAMLADYEAEAAREAAMGIGYWIFRDEDADAGRDWEWGEVA